MNAADVVVAVIRLSGGELFGRTRLQKTVYLLDRCGADIGLTFSYHYYGPYSFELTDGWVDAEAEGWISVEEGIGNYAVPYSIFRAKKSRVGVKSFGKLGYNQAKKAVQRMHLASNTVLELAATMVYLYEDCSGDSIIEELKSLKPNKATDGLIAEAECLLEDLDLDPVKTQGRSG